MGLKIRKIEDADRSAIFGWVEALGWNPGEKDAECLLATDPDGMFVAERNGAPVGCATAIAYDGQFGFVGAMIVDPAIRGKGPATMLAICRHVMAYLGERSIGLDAIPATRHFFTGAGFLPGYRHWRFEGVLPEGRTDASMIPVTDVSFADLCGYDAASFPARRERFWRVWLDAYGAGGLACIREGRLAGFGMVRRARCGWRLGPLQADDPQAAEALLLALAPLCRGEPVALDVPEANPAAMALVHRLGLAPVSETMRMYNRAWPELAVERVYAIPSYEFG